LKHGRINLPSAVLWEWQTHPARKAGYLMPTTLVHLIRNPISEKIS